MSGFDPPVAAVRAVVRAALEEDFGALGDLTSLAVVPEDAPGAGRFVARGGGVIAGTAAATEVFRQVDPSVMVRWTVADGDDVDPGAELGRVEGPARSLLGAERTALNLLCHCSGVATLTRRFV
ncbi:MAG: nicotinate-nucleotide diphosphorylase, partial [Acidimicrobiia bacterium]